VDDVGSIWVRGSEYALEHRMNDNLQRGGGVVFLAQRWRGAQALFRGVFRIGFLECG
jgi:hypothetical protein